MPIVKTCARCARHIPVTETYCSEHRGAEVNRRRAKRAAMGLASARWKTVRERRLALDGHVCTFRLTGCTYQATSVHLDPSCRGNHRLATLNNTRSACLHCHGTVDAPRSQVA